MPWKFTNLDTCFLKNNKIKRLILTVQININGWPT